MKTMTTGSDPVRGSWTHSFEEDEPGIRVYRPTEGGAFPPARGRETLDFLPDGTVSRSGPGPDDRTVQRIENWTPVGMGRFSIGTSVSGEGRRVVEVIEHSAICLKLRDAH